MSHIPRKLRFGRGNQTKTKGYLRKLSRKRGMPYNFREKLRKARSEKGVGKAPVDLELLLDSDTEGVQSKMPAKAVKTKKIWKSVKKPGNKHMPICSVKGCRRRVSDTRRKECGHCLAKEEEARKKGMTNYYHGYSQNGVQHGF